MLTIIEIKDREDGGHGLQSQSHRTECWLEGWLAVPPELEQTAWDCAGYCDLDIQDGKLVGLTPREQPPKPEPEPDLTPQFRTAMLSYAATSTAIPDSYALDMSDLFPTWAAATVRARAVRTTTATVREDRARTAAEVRTSPVRAKDAATRARTPPNRSCARK